MSLQPSFACFGCFDFANNARTRAYVNWACATERFVGARPKLNWMCMCPDDGDVSDYNDPETDSICWFDPKIPESLDFLGVIVTDVRGLRSSTYTRETSEAVGGGSILGRPQRLGKSFVFEALILASSEAGFDYGFEWLRRVFEDDGRCPKGGSTCSSCQGQVLTMRVHCPEEDHVDLGVRTWPTTGTVDGVDLVEDDYPMGRRNCFTMRRITWTMQTETDVSFSPDPIESDATASNSEHAFTAPGIEPPGPPDFTCCAFCGETNCNPCGTDPGCDCFPPLALAPIVIDRKAPCYEDPATRLIGAMSIEDVYAGYDTTIRLTLEAGFDPSNPDFSKYGMRNVAIRIWENHNGLAVPQSWPEYQALASTIIPCTEIGISWVPPGSELVIDGTTQTSWLKCNGACVDHSGRVSGIDSDMWPLVYRCVPIIITIEWDQDNVMNDDAGGRIPSTATVESFLRYRM